MNGSRETQGSGNLSTKQIPLGQVTERDALFRAVQDLVSSSVVIPNAEGGGISLAITAALFFAHESLIWAR